VNRLELRKEATHNLNRSGKAARLDLRDQSHSREPMGLPAFGEVIAVGVEFAAAHAGLLTRCDFGPQELTHGVAGMTGHACDLSH